MISTSTNRRFGSVFPAVAATGALVVLYHLEQRLGIALPRLRRYVERRRPMPPATCAQGFHTEAEERRRTYVGTSTRTAARPLSPCPRALMGNWMGDVHAADINRQSAAGTCVSDRLHFSCEFPAAAREWTSLRRSSSGVNALTFMDHVALLAAPDCCDRTTVPMSRIQYCRRHSTLGPCELPFAITAWTLASLLPPEPRHGASPPGWRSPTTSSRPRCPDGGSHRISAYPT